MPELYKMDKSLQALFVHSVRGGGSPIRIIRNPVQNQIRKIRQHKRMTLEQVAEKAETSFAQIQKLEKGERRLTVDWMQRIAKALGCAPQDLISDSLSPIESNLELSNNLNPTLTSTHVKVAGYVIRGEVNFVDNLGTIEAPEEAVKAGAVALIVKDNDNHPVYKKGDAVLYVPLVGMDKSFIGHDCVVETDDGRTLLCELHPGSAAGLYMLARYGAPALYDVKLKWASPVRWAKKF